MGTVRKPREREREMMKCARASGTDLEFILSFSAIRNSSGLEHHFRRGRDTCNADHGVSGEASSFSIHGGFVDPTSPLNSSATSPLYCSLTTRYLLRCSVAIAVSSRLLGSLVSAHVLGASELQTHKFLLKQRLAFHGHDESEYSRNRENFIELLRFLADHSAEIFGVVLQNAPSNCKLVCSDIQKEIVHAASIETTNKIIEELGQELFSVLVDESRDISCKEQMAVVLRFVSKQGMIVERFLAIVRVSETTSMSLKVSLEELFCKHGLSFSRLRGQGYDGASNMRDEFNRLKALILKENSCAYYVHCFAHQLQLVLVAIAEKHKCIATLFTYLSNLQSTAGASCQRRDKLREERTAEIQEALKDGDLSIGTCSNQETSLARPGTTRWSSHYRSLTNLTILFGAVMSVLEDILENAKDAYNRGNASSLLDSLATFEFVFSCLFMKNVLAITHELSQALQKKEQEIINAVDLVVVAKLHLQNMRDNG
ncbi:hypothetical protein LUZ63_016126 [Rhynchospora breviuscula]|uniref:DUF4371 domain-containing protein n=1 Tax=Rhynchospora breviuscula TaxID=2022672 RepID=A0A9Q0CDM5_9POAL|nr:hypothetical protein LUZ63_016126 [Rhynchospora breviuscula]